MMKSNALYATLLLSALALPVGASSTSAPVAAVAVASPATAAAPVAAAPVATAAAVANQAPAPTVVPNLDPNGESYIANIAQTAAAFNHREMLSMMTAVSQIQPSPNADQAIVAIQKTQNGIFRSQPFNAKANGLVTNPGDLAAFAPMFHLKKNDRFVLNVTQNLDGTGPLVSYIGQVLHVDGDGQVDGDTLCFVRYLMPSSPSANVASASPAPVAAAAVVASPAPAAATTSTTTATS